MLDDKRLRWNGTFVLHLKNYSKMEAERQEAQTQSLRAW